MHSALTTLTLSVQDIRATEKDKVEVYKCFRPGDIVTARVISLGDARSYYLATDANELGVIHALSGAGTKMVPISWCEMQDPASGIKVSMRQLPRSRQHCHVARGNNAATRRHTAG